MKSFQPKTKHIVVVRLNTSLIYFIVNDHHYNNICDCARILYVEILQVKHVDHFPKINNIHDQSLSELVLDLHEPLRRTGNLGIFSVTAEVIGIGKVSGEYVEK